MKNPAIILMFLFAFITSWGQSNLTQAEYFFDSDPGMGSALPIAGFGASASIDVNDMLDVSGLSIGMHTLGIRIMDDNNIWSMAEYIPVFVTLSNANILANLTAAEYFFDTDPGMGAGSSITLSATQNLDLNEMFPTSALSIGMHSLNIRIRNEFDQWSMVETIPIFVTKASALFIEDIDQVEYFFDNDPGLGLATPLTIATNQNVDINDLIPTGSLSTGMHTLNIRIRTTNAEWSLTESMPVYINQDNVITQLEYFVDTDPGIGLATPVTITSTQIPLDQQFIVPTSTLSLGDHEIFVRIKNDFEFWSPTNSAMFSICDGANALFSADTVRIGSTTTFTDKSINVQAGDTYSWDFESDGTIDDITVGSTNFIYPSFGVYTATLVIDRIGCSDTSFLEVLVLDQGALLFFGENNSGPIILENQSVDLGSTLLNSNLDKIFVLDNRSSTNTMSVSSIISDNSTIELLNIPTLISPLSFEQFTVRLIAQSIGIFNGNISISTDAGNLVFGVIGEVLANNLSINDLNIYNVVTPNGDGVHDFFRIGNIESFIENTVSIFNRWGDKVFELKNYDNLGNIFAGIGNVGSSSELDTGNYYYAIDRGDGSKRETGYLFLKR